MCKSITFYLINMNSNKKLLYIFCCCLLIIIYATGSIFLGFISLDLLEIVWFWIFSAIFIYTYSYMPHELPTTAIIIGILGTLLYLVRLYQEWSISTLGGLVLCILSVSAVIIKKIITKNRG
jgi:hypothetical protein